MSSDEVDLFITGRHSMAVATYDPRGAIHLVAMWYGFVGGLVALETKAKSQKARNVLRDPRITVMVESGETYEQLRGVEIVGRAEVRDDRETLVELAHSVIPRYSPPDDPRQLDAMVENMIHKRVAILIQPQRIVSWDHTKLP